MVLMCRALFFTYDIIYIYIFHWSEVMVLMCRALFFTYDI